MIRYLKINLLFSLVLYFACSPTVNKNSGKSDLSLEKDLYGQITIDELYNSFPAWKDLEVNYKPEEALIKLLSEIDRNNHVEIFLGTWCGDSRREVPHFIKIWKSAGLNTTMPILIYALDRNKEIDNGLATNRNIQFVPTFIFYSENKELGRIVESPDESLEKDVITILTSESNY